jgi:eukaryotic-like serine/threonine-protein kinase
MSELLAALKMLQQESSGHVPISRMLKKRRVAIPVLSAFIAMAFLVGWGIHRSAQVRWAHETAIPKIARLAEKGEDLAAFALAKKVEAVAPDDSMLEKLWPEISLQISVHSQPEGAEIFMKPYGAPEGSWEHSGRSPIEHLRVPFGLLRWRAQKQGFEPAELLTYSIEKQKELRFLGKGTTVNLSLAAPGTIPEGMVRIPGQKKMELEIPGIEKAVSIVDLPDYWMDRFEVTNKQFKGFVDAGGYRKPEYWKQPFVENGRKLSWEEAMSRFGDKEGRPGPATWELGNYPKGKGTSRLRE